MLVKQPAIYIMASGRNGTIYTGVTSDLIKRVYEHKYMHVPGFTQKHRCKYPVYYELIEDAYFDASGSLIPSDVDHYSEVSGSVIPNDVDHSQPKI